MRRAVALLPLLCLVLTAASCPEKGGPAGTEVTVLTLNVRYGTADDGPNAWSERRDAVFTLLERERPDVIGLQEVLAFQRDELLAGLREYDLFGAGRDDGADAGEMCPILWRLDTWEFLEGGHFWLSETPGRPGSRSWDAALPRMVTWLRLARLDDPTLELVVMNTHFDHRGAEARRQSAALLVERADELVFAGEPLVVTGDFNAPADRDPAGAGRPWEILRQAGWTDAWRAANPDAEPPGTFHGFRGGTGGARVDGILVSGPVDVIGAAVLAEPVDGRPVSDHHPVRARLRVRSVPR